MNPSWIYLSNPVPQPVADRAAQLLKTPGVHIGMAWIEISGGIDCSVAVAKGVQPIKSQVLRYTCEDHGHGITGISVYGLV